MTGSGEPTGRARRELLEGIGLLACLPAESLDRIGSALVACEFSPGEAIVREGEEGRDLFIVESGDLLVTVRRGDVAVPVGKLGPHDFFGEMAVLQSTTRRATVTAVGAVIAWKLSSEALEHLMRVNPVLRERLHEQMRRREVANAFRGLQ